MCGICGLAGANLDSVIVEEMCHSLSHRGPDGSGMYRNARVVLGHTRLSIIDLVTGDQPMSNEDETVWVVFNGEIYNYRALRRELEMQGHCFRSDSDTEVLVHLYEEQGETFLPRLDGMFAFALWDVRRQRLILARDCFGIKPLHYYFDGATLRFGSEVKALLMDPSIPRRVNFQTLHYFLNLRFIPGEDTLFENIRRLPPAHLLVFENGTVRITPYYQFTPLENSHRGEAFYAEGIRHYLREAVRKQLVSDVPLGVYLSGGLDSSAIVGLMSEMVSEPIRTFTMGFDEPTDELEDARLVANFFATDHHEIVLRPDPLRDLARVIWHAEEPKENILQGYLLSRFAREHVKVVLGGLGGDELFAGYTLNEFIYPVQSLHRLMPRVVGDRLLRPLGRFIFDVQNRSGMLTLDEYRRGMQMLLALGDPEYYYLILRNVWDYDRGKKASLYGPALRDRQFSPTHTAFDRFFQDRSIGALEQVLWAEFNTKMVDDFLANEDRTAMAHGLEVRVPFLDRDLVQFAFSIPVGLRMRGRETKYIFRRAMEGVLPAQTLRKKKWGFSFNPYYQFRKDLRGVAERVLARQRLETQGLFNYQYIRRILDHPPHPRLRWHYFFLWNLVGFQIWHKMFIEGDPRRPCFDLESYMQD